MARHRPAIGHQATIEVIVTEDMLVDLRGRRIHPVYATAWMVRHMEEAGRMLVEPYLRDGEDATGYEIEVTHESPARVGDRLRVVARVAEADERLCRAELEVLGPGGRVGRGTLVQRYIRAGTLAEGGS